MAVRRARHGSAARWRRWRRWLLAALLALAGGASADPPAEALGPRLKVLASYHRGNPWTDELLRHIEAAAERLDASVDVDYLDARRLLEGQAFALERARLAGRRAVTPGERLLLLDDAALRFYLAHAEALGDPGRVMALGINDPELARRGLSRGVRLIDTAAVGGQSVAFLEAAFGAPLPLLVLGDNTPVGQDLTRTFLAQLTRRAPGRLAGVLWDWTPEEVVEALAGLPADTRVYLVEGQTTGAGDLDARRREWLPALAARGIPVFCHLPYQLKLGCAGGAQLDTRRLGSLAVESLLSPAFARLPARQTVGSGRRVLDARWSATVPPALAGEIEWRNVGSAMDEARRNRQRLLWASAGVGGVLAAGLAGLAWLRRREARRQRRLLVDRATGLPSRQLLEADLANPHRRRDGWVFVLTSPRLREMRTRFGLAAAQALLRDQVAEVRRALPDGWRLYAGSGFSLLGWVPASSGGEHVEARLDTVLARLDERLGAAGDDRLAWHASLLRLAGHEADIAQCGAALDEGIMRLERTGWRQPLLRVTPLPLEAATRFRRLAEEVQALIEAPETQWRLVVQPQLAADGVTPLGAEALIRWRHPALGEVSPVEFLPVVERLGLSARLDAWVIDQALAWLARHRDRLADLPRLSVNVSLPTLQRDRFVAELDAALSRWGVPGERLEIEVTEHADFGDLALADAALGRLRRLGVRVALDDFGTGYTAFRLLQRLPFDTVKLDRGLLAAAGHHERAVEAYAAMVSFCRQLGLEVIAEGVETEREAEWLIGLGVRVLQGYHYARPLELDAFLARYAGPSTPGRGRPCQADQE